MMENKNNLIAEFMGAKQDSYPDSMPKWVNIFGIWEDNPKLEYHCSWDWLMPVVEKIAKEFDVTISFMPNAIDATYINRPDTIDGEVTSLGGMSPIENTYYSVVKFIEWYNTKSKYRNLKNK